MSTSSTSRRSGRRLLLVALGAAALVIGAVLASLTLNEPSEPKATDQASPVGPAATPSPEPAASIPAPSTSPTSPASGAVDRRPSTVLGPQWRRSGPAADRRDADEVLALVIPLGCVQRSPLPRPVRVVEDTFVHKRATVAAVALRLTFSTRRDARVFLAVREADLRACRNQPDDPFSGAAAPVSGVSPGRGGLSLSERTDPYARSKRATWTELFVRDGRTVTGLAVNVGAAGGRSVDLSAVRGRLVNG
jgi:hypothetical protein